MSDRYLLCRPRGGLNDSLCRIALCWEYAERFDRCLVIDCRNSALFGAFSDYFEIIHSSAAVVPTLNEQLLAYLNSLACRPATLSGRLHGYGARFELGRGFVDAQDGRPARFSNTYPMQFVDDFPEPLLLYDDSGGGEASFSLLPRIRLAHAVVTEVREVLASFPQSYHSLHVRNTDYRTDYRRLFSRIRRRVGRSALLVCSDDPAVIRDAEGYFAGPVLRTPRSVASAHPTGALHRTGSQATAEGRKRGAIESIIDLVCLANADVFYYAPTTSLYAGGGEFRRSGWPSGFSMLAEHLCANKDLLDSFLGSAVPERCERGAGAVVRVDVRSLPYRVGYQCLSGVRAFVRRRAG
jgi:hypothetical protein